MPNRIIKESICTSDSIDPLSWFDEVVFYRLIVNCDDYGRMDARLPVIKARLFPLKTVTESDIRRALNKLSAVGIVYLYSVDGKPYLQFVTWERHQQIRNKRSKFPEPKGSNILKNYEDLQTLDNSCNQVISNVPVIQSNPNQSESESEYKSKLSPSLSPPRENTPHPPSEEKKRPYGSEFGLVKLTDDEYGKLAERLGKSSAADYIDRLDGWLAEGHRKKNHYATVLNWWRKDNNNGENDSNSSQFKPSGRTKGSNPSNFKPSRQ